DTNSLAVHETVSLPYADALRQRLLLATRNQADPDELGELDTLVGQHFAEAGAQLIKQSGINPKQIRAAGSHGQTIR
ncbi:MAG TPA: anhydro-N-acetylmuramic acid kinase, partial [Marinobacter hydrocarbonoclasticus]|nr:anhydro-N-acetylmuramic acid kinase [Marinobacter nauticus]